MKKNGVKRMSGGLAGLQGSDLSLVITLTMLGGVLIYALVVLFQALA